MYGNHCRSLSETVGSRQGPLIWTELSEGPTSAHTDLLLTSCLLMLTQGEWLFSSAQIILQWGFRKRNQIQNKEWIRRSNADSKAVVRSSPIYSYALRRFYPTQLRWGGFSIWLHIGARTEDLLRQMCKLGVIFVIYQFKWSRIA